MSKRANKRNQQSKMNHMLQQSKNDVKWDELDKHRDFIIENITNQASLVQNFLEDEQVANIIDSDKESKIFVEGFSKDLINISEDITRIKDEHKDKTGKIENHLDYVKMMQLFEEYNETAMKFDHSLQTVFTEINSKIALEVANRAAIDNDIDLHKEVINSGLIEEKDTPKLIQINEQQEGDK